MRPPHSADQELREALEAFADRVPQADDSYPSALGGWRRREHRRRRLVGALLLGLLVVAVVLALFMVFGPAPVDPVLHNSVRIPLSW